MFKRNVCGYVYLLMLTMLGCGASTGRAIKPIRTPVFNSPLTYAQTAPSDISIALINPYYGSAWTTGEEDGWSKLFRASLAKEIEQLIVSRGFKIVGPFATVEEMTFPQKKQSDLLLTPIINFNLQYPQAQTVTKTDWGSALLGGSGTKDAQVWIGPCISQGFISFEFWEPLSAQKMWTKKIDITPIQVDCSAKSAEAFLAAFNDGYAQLLEASYKTALAKADAYFSREEVELVVKQSQELRAKKVY